MSLRKKIAILASSIFLLNCSSTSHAAQAQQKKPKTATPVSDARVYSFTNGIGAHKTSQWVKLTDLTILDNAAQISNTTLPSRPQLNASLEWSDTTQPVTDPTKFLPWACWHLLQVQQPLAGKSIGPTLSDVCSALKDRRAYIIHIVHWARAGGTFNLRSNDWYVYEKKGKSLSQVRFSPDGDPVLDDDADALLFGIHIFDSITDDEKSVLKVAYSATPTETVPQNLQNLAQVVEALVGATGNTPNAAAAPQALVIVGLVPGSVRLPYKLVLSSSFSVTKPKSVSDSGNAPSSIMPPDPKSVSNDASNDGSKPTPDNASNGTTPAPVDCSAIDSTTKPCVISHTLQSNEREWWDVSLGVAIPGVKQTNFSAPSGTVVATTTTHTDVYAFFNLGYNLQNRLRTPHLDFGIPVASQPLYRPFIGVGEWLTPLFGLEKRKFPLRVGVFVGAVFAKQYSPTTLSVGSAATAGALASDLRSYRVTKLLVGAEFSVSELIGKIKPKSKSQ